MCNPFVAREAARQKNGGPTIPMPDAMLVPAIAIALVVSMVIGLVAGGYPAWRAARLRPIEALRYQ